MIYLFSVHRTRNTYTQVLLFLQEDAIWSRTVPISPISRKAQCLRKRITYAIHHQKEQLMLLFVMSHLENQAKKQCIIDGLVKCPSVLSWDAFSILNDTFMYEESIAILKRQYTRLVVIAWITCIAVLFFSFSKKRESLPRSEDKAEILSIKELQDKLSHVHKLPQTLYNPKDVPRSIPDSNPGSPGRPRRPRCYGYWRSRHKLPLWWL